jgi:hypothetical protein
MVYDIVPDGVALWRIKQMKGIMPPSLLGSFTSYREAEVRLVLFLKTTDRPWKQAVYPEEYRHDG